MARPRKDHAERRTRTIGVRLTPTERAAVEAAATARGVTPAECLRTAFMAGSSAVPMSSPAATVSALDPAAIAALNHVGANLNQLARRANSGDLLQPGELPEALSLINEHLARIESLVFSAIET